jgi:NADH-quinone oxidoreductase subunit I
MFCALCVDPCPVDCIFMGSNFDLSTFGRDGCVVDYAKLPLEVAWGQATLNPTAVMDSKRVSLPVWTKLGQETVQGTGDRRHEAEKPPS